MMRTFRIVPLGLAAVALLFAAAPPAEAIHLFPLTPVFDPLGHDCEQNLTPAPANPDATVGVVGFNFVDTESGTSTTTISAGETVNWQWLADHCHSVTFVRNDAPPSTEGSTTFNDESLVRMDGPGNDSFSATFVDPGTFSYFCEHHASVGMIGKVVVE